MLLNQKGVIISSRFPGRWTIFVLLPAIYGERAAGEWVHIITIVEKPTQNGKTTVPFSTRRRPQSLWWIMSVSAGFVLLCEFLQETVTPEAANLQSHLVTILCSATTAWVVTWYLLRERKHMIDLMHELRMLSSVVEHSPASVVITDKSGNIEYVNPRFTQLTGYSPGEVLGKNSRFLKSGSTSAADYKKLWATILDGKEWRGEFCNRKKSGEPFWESASIFPIRNLGGEITNFVALKKDITERKEMAQQLAELSYLNSKIITDAPAGIAVYKTSGECVMANPAAANIVGITPAEFIAQNFRNLESWRRSDLLKLADESIATGNPRRGECHGLTVSGRQHIWIEFHFCPISWNGRQHLLLILNDLTGRKNAEEKVHEQAALLDHARDAIFVLDMDSRIQYWNKGAERVFGWTAAEVMGRSTIDLFFGGIISRDLDLAMRTTREQDEWLGELKKISRSGRMVTVQSRSTLIRDDGGTPRSILIIDTDITEKKKLEEQFLRAQRMESLGALASGVAHDLNNVLTPLLISVQLLKEKTTDDDGRRILESLETNVKRGAHLIKQVLAFGRGADGERSPVLLLFLVNEIEQIIFRTFPKAIKFEFHAPRDLWRVIANPTELHQILLNLCVNARDAMPTGGLLSIEMKNLVADGPVVGIHHEMPPGKYVAITVTDTGTGMSPDVQRHVFEPFFTTKKLGYGTGLGLSTCLEIVRSYGGSIHCYSEPGKGTAFKIYLPANVTEPVAGNLPEPPDLPRGHNELVLVVDDEEPIRTVAQKTLERFGYRTVTAANGSEAVALYKRDREKINAVITDMAMPEMDGIDTIKALRSMNPGIPIIGCSGLDHRTIKTSVADAGIKHFLRKPYTAAAILQILNEALAVKVAR